MKVLICSVTMMALAGCGSVYSTVTSDTHSPMLVNEYTINNNQNCQSRYDETIIQYNKNGTITCREYKSLQ
jgi:hypothetical protein